MGLIKRAWLSVVRRKGKSLILLVVVFFLGNLISGTSAIKQATSRVEENTKLKLGFNATVRVDFQKLWDQDTNGQFNEEDMPKISESLIQKIGELPEVKHYDYSKKHMLYTKSLKQVAMEFDGGPEVGIFYGAEGDGDDFRSNFTLQGVEYLDVMDTKVGRIEMVSGRTFTQSDLEESEIPVILSEQVMELNNLRLDEVIEVNQVLEMLQVSESPDDYLNHNLKFKIIGSFKPVTFGKDSKGNYTVVEMLNRIYVPNHFIKEIVNTEIELAETNGIDVTDHWGYKEALEDNYEDSVFVTESENDLNSFVESATSYLDDILRIETSQAQFESIAFSMVILSQFSGFVLKGAILITVIVLSLVVVLFLRDRKHEMGIYLALGDRQWKVLSQVTLEVVMITLMGLTLSFGSATILANKISDSMIENNMYGEVYIDPYSSLVPAVNLAEIEEDYTISITPSYVLSVYGIGIAVAVASSVVPMFYVTRVKPKKILM